MSRHPTGAYRVVVGMVCALLLAVTAGCTEEKKVDFHGTDVKPPFDVAAAPLTSTSGKPLSLAKDLDKPLTLVFFGYTNCPDICPAVLASVASGFAKLSKADRKKVGLVFVTTDPKRDTAQVLTRYLDRFDPGFVGATGSLATIAAVGKSVGIFVDQGKQLAGGGYDPNSHGTYVIGVGPNGKAPAFWDGETSPSEFAQDVRFLLHQAS